ncbi:hypothetical protein D3C79_949970 [compost metagenome]
MQRNVLVVLTGIGVVEDIRHLLLVRRAQHERGVVESVLGEQGQGLRVNLEDFLAGKFADGNVITA